MKKTTSLALALFTAAALAGTASADTAKSAAHPHHGPTSADRIVEHMNKELNLTAEQQSKLKTIFTEEGQKLSALRKETHAQVNKVLTPEQQAKAKKLREERAQKMKEKRAEWKKAHAAKH